MKKKRKPTYLSFKLSKENYAISTKKVLEVLSPQPITPIPNSPDFVKGIIAFRGNMVPVVCIANKLNLNDNCESENYVIIICDVNLNKKKAILAAIANSVNEVISADDESILAPPENGMRFDKNLSSGMLKHNNNFIHILDVDKIFALK